RRFHGALRVRHQAGDVAFAVTDTGDVVHRAVRIAGGIIGSKGIRVVKQDLAVALQLGEGGGVDGVGAVAVRDWDLQNLTFSGGAGERTVGFFDADVNVAADKAQAGVAHHGTGEEARFAQNLETVADAEHNAAAFGERFYGLHDRRETRDGAGPEIVTVGKSAGQDNGVAAPEV